MAFEIKGRVKSVSEVKQVTEKFAKRELVIETGLDSKYPQVVMLETSGDRNSLLDPISSGDTVTVQFDVRGREGRDGRVWNTLSIWKLNVDGKAPQRGTVGGASDDLPF